MSALLILGAGGHALSVADAALSCGRWESVAFLDDAQNENALGPLLPGGLAGAETLSVKYLEACVALGNNALRLQWLKKLRTWGYRTPSIVHPKAIVSRFAEVGGGCVLMAGAIVNVQAKISDGCILNTGCTVDHNCIIGEGVHLSPGVHIGGDTEIGTRTWVCVGASVGSQRAVCADCVIAAGAVVVKDIAEPGLYAGVPAIKKR